MTTDALDGCPTWVKPIRPSVKDNLTTGTARQILTHNETREAVCAEE